MRVFQNLEFEDINLQVEPPIALLRILAIFTTFTQKQFADVTFIDTEGTDVQPKDVVTVDSLVPHMVDLKDHALQDRGDWDILRNDDPKGITFKGGICQIPSKHVSVNGHVKIETGVDEFINPLVISRKVIFVFLVELAIGEVNDTFHVGVLVRSYPTISGILLPVFDVLEFPDLVTYLAWDGEETRYRGSHGCVAKLGVDFTAGVGATFVVVWTNYDYNR